MALFDHLARWQGQRLGGAIGVAHLWDHLPRTASWLKRQGVPLLLDLHMAHPRCLLPLVEAGRVDPAALGRIDDPDAVACLALADVIVCPSEFVRRSLPEEAWPRARVIPFGAPALGEPPPRDGGGEVTVLFAGNVNYRKGIVFLLEAWRRLAPAGARLVICGRIHRPWDRLIERAPPSVRFLGHCADMRGHYAAADLFVLPSLMEGSAKAVLEAMAHGLPSVVSTHTGTVVEHGREGLVVPPADVDALAEALDRLIGDARLRAAMAAAARGTARHYTWERYADGIAALYRPFGLDVGTAR
jgi:glycosyltransferase involved in cell wall biosynthesis